MNCGAGLRVGLLGFALHVRADLQQAAPTFLEKVMSGAPPMAPLLFPNLVILGLIALWVIAGHLAAADTPDL